MRTCASKCNFAHSGKENITRIIVVVVVKEHLVE